MDRRLVMMAMALVLSGTAGCRMRVLKSVSAGRVGCAPAEVEITEYVRRPTASWVATCHGRKHYCSIAGDVQCTASGGSTHAAARTSSVSTRPASATARSTTPRTAVKRGYDEASGSAMVAASFTFPEDAKLIMGGAPGKAMGVIQLQFTTPPVHVKDCAEFEVVVNAVPHDVTELDSENLGLGYRRLLSGYTRFEWYKPLATRYPEFSLRACDAEVKFDALQIEALKEFLTIYSELAVGQQQQDGVAPGGAPLPPGTQL